MKQTITKYELALLDGLAVTADSLRDAQQSLAENMRRLLLCDVCELRACRSIESYVESGAPESIEQFLDALNVSIDDPLVPDDSPQAA